MKILSRSCQILAFMCCGLALAAQGSSLGSIPTELSELPVELQPLKSELLVVYQHLLAADPSYGRLLEAEAVRSTQTQKWFPVIAAQTGIDRSQRRAFTDGAETVSNSPQTNLQYGINLKQNIFAGGNDLYRNEVAKLGEQAAQLRHQLSWKNSVRQWILDSIEIQFYAELVKFSDEASQQAQQLNQLARRKEASGFLGKRDLLETEREMLRTSDELQKNKSNLNQLTQKTYLKYGVRPDALPKKKTLENLLRMSDKLLALPTSQIVDSQAPQSLPWRIADTERQLAERDLSRIRSVRFSPSIDANAGFSEAKILGEKNEANSRATVFDKTQQWTISVSGSVQLNPPVAFGSVDEALQQLLSTKQNQTKTQREVSLSLSSSTERLRLVLERKRVTERLVEATTKIREQNQRLFEAGEISLDRLILSQQDLDRDRKILVTLTNEENLLRAEMGLSALWNLPPNASAAMASP